MLVRATHGRPCAGRAVAAAGRARSPGRHRRLPRGAPAPGGRGGGSQTSRTPAEYADEVLRGVFEALRPVLPPGTSRFEPAHPDLRYVPEDAARPARWPQSPDANPPRPQSIHLLSQAAGCVPGHEVNKRRAVRDAAQAPHPSRSPGARTGRRGQPEREASREGEGPAPLGALRVRWRRPVRVADTPECARRCTGLPPRRQAAAGGGSQLARGPAGVASDVMPPGRRRGRSGRARSELPRRGRLRTDPG